MENKDNINGVNINEERDYSVYMHINLENLKLYFGITRRTPKRRWNNGNGYKGNIYFWEDIEIAKKRAENEKLDKDGWDKYFAHLVLFKNLTKAEAEAKEIELIAEYRTTERDRGYNIEYGGNSNNKTSEETREKISKLKKGGNHPKAKKVYCDGMIFSCVKECAEYYNINDNSLTRWLTHRRKSMPQELIMLGLKYASKKEIKKYEMYDPNKHGEKANSNTPFTRKLNKFVYCDNFIFESLTQCSNHYNVPYARMYSWMIGRCNMHLDFARLGLRMATQEDIEKYPLYIEKSDNEINKIIEVTKGKNDPKGKKVFCNGKIFQTCKQCSKYYNINYNTMGTWLRGGNKMPSEFIELGLRYATREDIQKYPPYIEEQNKQN